MATAETNKGILSRIPENKNLLSQINFKMLLRRSPNVDYFCSKVNIPGIILPVVWQNTPFVDIPQTGDRASFKPLVVTFKVDEDLINYMNMYSWLRDLGFTDQFQQYKDLKSHPQYTGVGLRSDIVVSILDSTRNANFTITYYDAIPIELSDLQFDAQALNPLMVNASVVIRYLNWDYELSTNTP